MLRSGTKLGPYEVVSPLGSGGMGEVYRARDTKLGRDVAIKILPGDMAGDPLRLARFKREAQMLASLNHPNIAAIHGFEESDGVRALVMELVDGQTLAERNVGAGLRPATTDDALLIARQIAEALEYAHDHGIIHRDLKPANIKITPEGVVKILDFGLAKALEVDPSSSNPAHSPTLSPTLSIAATQAGMILGTAAYMSPEQAKGKSVDRRADIWAFGCVLYEMLTGSQTFTGETVTDVLAAVVRADPEWKEIPEFTPAPIVRLIHRCLIKDPKQRLRDIGEARITIEETISGVGAGFKPAPTEANGSATAASPPRLALPWALAGLLSLISVVLGFLFVSRKPVSPLSISASINIHSGVTGGVFAISPDGRRFTYLAPSSGGRPQLWVRPLDSFAAQALSGTEGALYPFWSPDSRYIGFFADGKLKKIDASGGAAQALCDAPDGRGGSWGPNGTIAFAPGIFTGISLVSETGGAPSPLTPTPKAGDSDRFPGFLPDGRHVLYLSLNASGKQNHLRAVSVDNKEVKTVGEIESGAVYDSAGYLLYVRDGNLVAQHFDPNSYALSGDAIPIVEQIQFIAIRGNASFSVSSGGVLAYQSAKQRAMSQLTWFDRDGNRLGTLGEPAQVFSPSISPDGKKVIASITADSGKYSLWMFDVTRAITSRFTFTNTNDDYAIWSPDGKLVAYSKNGASGLDMFVKPANGVEGQKPLVNGEGESFSTDWSHDGRFIVYQAQSSASRKFDIWILPMTGNQKPYPFIATDADEEQGVFSPDGRWLAYVSDESGRPEIYVVPFPNRQGKWQVSSSGGYYPSWPASGTEIDYFTPDRKWMAVEVNGKGNDFTVGSAKALFGGKPVPGAIVGGPAESPDGKKLLVPVPSENGAASVDIVTNWRATLRK